MHVPVYIYIYMTISHMSSYKNIIMSLHMYQCVHIIIPHPDSFLCSREAENMTMMLFSFEGGETELAVKILWDMRDLCTLISSL